MTARLLRATGEEANAAADAAAVDEAERELAHGHVVAVPTDTVYGLAVDPFHPGATGALFSLKRRPARVGLPLLVAGRDQARQVAELPATAERLTESFWPGPLTVVVRRTAGLTLELGGDGATVGLRCPDHPVVRELCRRVGPLAVTSANRHGEPDLTTAGQVVAGFGDELVLALDGGRCDGAPSTVVDCTGPVPRCLRQGDLAWDEVLRAAG